ncbi:hypothetical protein A9Q91_00965 [Candidatus Gracilibacteria bacterium 28_42_T64]|nr:hypothetical protein A9Q91_00965 [Candidatus Gracilibacteria bacterium 28_42_T64]
MYYYILIYQAVNFLSKIIFVIIVIILGSGLISLSFISSDYSKIEEISSQDIEIGLYDLQVLDQTGSLKKITTSSKNINILAEKLSLADTIYSSGDYTKTLTGAITHLKLKSGIYLLHLNELHKKYIISGGGFQIKNSGPGIFLVNSFNPKKVVIFSINTKLQLSLINTETNTPASSLDLYPHTYITIKPKWNRFLLNADLFKISQSFPLTYFNEPLITGENNINPLFLQSFSSNEVEYNFLKDTFHYILLEYQKSSQEIQYLSDAIFSPFPGEIFIKKYYELFLNNEKKQIYNENLILKSLHEIINKKEEVNESINFISETMNDLKKNNTAEYKKMLGIIYFYYKNVLFTTNEDNTHLLNFSHLYLQLNKKKASSISPSILSLKNTFLSYDFKQSNNLYSQLNTFIKKYDEDENKKPNSSLLFFLEQILITDLKDTNAKELILFFNNYVNISETYYDTNNLTILHTGLLINSKILRNFTYIIRNNFFEKERTKEGLLKTVSLQNNTYENYILLEKNIIKLISFYNTNKNILDPEKNNEKTLRNEYIELQKIFDEYFLALSDYKAYTIKYDSRFGGNDPILDNGKTDAEKLSKDKALIFLSNFQGLLLMNTHIELKNYNYCQNPEIEETEDTTGNIFGEYECYKINNLNIGKETFSFLLHPYDGNKINTITFINEKGEWEEKKGSYDLNDMKESLEEKYKAAQSSEKDKYDFKKFFLNNFIIESKKQPQPIIGGSNEPDIGTEDKFTKYFKRNKLLGTNGDFTKIDDYFSIIYNNIRMTQESNSTDYDIYISGVQFGMNINKNGKTIKYSGVLNSDYTYASSHSFSDIDFKLLDLKAKEQNTYLLSGNSVYIVGDVPLESLKETLSSILNNIEAIEHIINTTSNTLGKEEISISYKPENETIEFKTNYGDKHIGITMQKGQIIDFNVNDIKIIDFIFHYSELGNFLTPIK